MAAGPAPRGSPSPASPPCSLPGAAGLLRHLPGGRPASHQHVPDPHLRPLLLQVLGGPLPHLQALPSFSSDPVMLLFGHCSLTSWIHVCLECRDHRRNKAVGCCSVLQFLIPMLTGTGIPMPVGIGLHELEEQAAVMWISSAHIPAALLLANGCRPHACGSLHIYA